jgi:hypothetical protein
LGDPGPVRSRRTCKLQAAVFNRIVSQPTKLFFFYSKSLTKNDLFLPPSRSTCVCRAYRTDSSAVLHPSESWVKVSSFIGPRLTYTGRSWKYTCDARISGINFLHNMKKKIEVVKKQCPIISRVAHAFLRYSLDHNWNYLCMYCSCQSFWVMALQTWNLCYLCMLCIYATRTLYICT